MKRWLIVVAIVFCLIAGLITWRLHQKITENAARMQQKSAKMKGPVQVSLAEVALRDIIRNFGSTGSVEAPLSVKIAPKITGRIEYLNVHEGNRVRKGQVLVRIDDSEIEAEVRQKMAAVAEAEYRLAQAQLNQTPSDVSVHTQIKQQEAAKASAEADYAQSQTSYSAQLAGAKASLSDAESKVENAKAAVNSAQANLNNAKTRYDRIDGLYKQGYIAAQDVDDAKAAMVVQESALEIAKGLLRSANAQHEATRQQYNVIEAKGKADVQAASAKLAQSKASLEYAKANTSQKGAYRQSIAALRASVEAAKASLKSAQAKRRDTILVSPLDGYVTGRHSDPGAIASPTQPIVSVQFIKQIWVAVSVPEEVCAKLHIGQPVKIVFDAYPDSEYNANIIQINPAADPQSRQFTVRVILSNSENLFKPGMFAHVSFETDKIKNALSVPREAVLAGRDGSYVVAVDKDRKAKHIPVIKEGESTEFISIAGQVKPGDKVITMSAMPVKDGQEVTIGKKGKNGGKARGGAKK